MYRDLDASELKVSRLVIGYKQSRIKRHIYTSPPQLAAFSVLAYAPDQFGSYRPDPRSEHSFDNVSQAVALVAGN